MDDESGQRSAREGGEWRDSETASIRDERGTLTRVYIGIHVPGEGRES